MIPVTSNHLGEEFIGARDTETGNGIKSHDECDSPLTLWRETFLAFNRTEQSDTTANSGGEVVAVFKTNARFLPEPVMAHRP